MAKIDLDSLNIDELAALRERVTEKLAEKVAARQVELEAEMERLSQFGKPAKKAQAAPAAKAKKSDETEGERGEGAERRLRMRPRRPRQLPKLDRTGNPQGRAIVGTAFFAWICPVIASDLRSGVERLGDMIAAASSIVPFTGAGISTECGIPDFRSPGGIWTRNRPIPFDEFVTSQDARDEAWRRRFAMEPTFAAAKPGRGHRALASLYRAGKTPAIITQNIDNLASGVRLQGRPRHRTARQYHLCPLHRLRAGLRPAVGQDSASTRPAARRIAPRATSR